jgi:hypothetical protein
MAQAHQVELEPLLTAVLNISHVGIRTDMSKVVGNVINAERAIITDLVSLRSYMVDAEIVKQQRHGLRAEEQSLEARHVYPTGICRCESLFCCKTCYPLSRKLKATKALTI